MGLTKERHEKMLNGKKIFICAGEPSADFLGGQLIKQLKILDHTVSIMGIGGIHMQQQGLKSLFPMAQLSLMGLFEVLPHLFSIHKLLNETVEAIVLEKPDVVVTIDAPGFNFVLAKRLRKCLGAQIKLVHYVAPSVWAWKPKRAQKIAKLYDHLLTLFPMEPPYFEKYGLATTFIGHPLIELGIKNIAFAPFRNAHNIPDHSPILCVLPGSRKAEVERLLPIFKKTIAGLALKEPDLRVVIPTLPQFHHILEKATASWAVPTLVTSDITEKYQAMRSGRVALAASGTVALELAMAKIPMVITYKMNLLTVWIAKRLIKVPYVCLVNILLGRRSVPELLQGDCRPSRLAEVLSYLMEDTPCRREQKNDLAEMVALLTTGETPSLLAARIVMEQGT